MSASGHAAIVQHLLGTEPWIEVCKAPTRVGAHGCRSVIDLWLRFELLSGRREEPPYWSVVWPGAKLLAAVLLNNPAFVFGRRVVDVGCGAGVAGIAAAKAG